MRFRSTFVLFGVFVVLGGYVYFAEYRGRDEREQQEAAKKKLFSTPLKDVTELSLLYPDHRISAVKKDDKHWEITEPKGIDADPEEWETLASSLGQIEKEDTVSSAKSDLAPYGLDKPVVEVRAKMKDGHTVDVLFGAQNPKKSENYAKLADAPEVFLSPANWSMMFQKSLTELRNKKVLEFTVDDVNSIRIQDGKSQIEFQKSGTDWLFKKPLEGKNEGNEGKDADGQAVDSAEVTGLLSTIQSARAANFADGGISEASAGLGSPESKITLHDGKANTDRVLSVGKSPEAGKYYAQDASRAAIMIIDKDIPEKLHRPVKDWRDRSVAPHLDTAGIDEIEIVRGADKVLLKKQGADWKLPDGRKAQSEKVSNLLVSLEFERASQILDTTGSSYGNAANGLDKPRIEARLRGAGKDVIALKFGNATRNPDGSYLKVSTNPAVMIVSADFYEKLNLKADDLAETQPATK